MQQFIFIKDEKIWGVFILIVFIMFCIISFLPILWQSAVCF